MDTGRYKKEIQDIKKYALNCDVSEEQVNKILEESFYLLETKTSSRIVFVLKLVKYCILTTIIIFLSCLVLYNHPKLHHLFLRNLQNFIYPGLRIFRKLAVPIITTYPFLTEWYDEWCLVENPYFQVNEMDCWPCNSVNSIQDLTGYNITPAFNIGVPFIRLEKSEPVNINKIYQMYIKYQNVFISDALPVTSNKPNFRTIQDVMKKKLNIYPFSNGNTHIKWRINRMEPSRKLRELFPKLLGIPDWWSPSTEKFIFIDEPKSNVYNLPNPECANTIIQCTSGERLIQLYPSSECSQSCKKLSILLSAHQSLWYNWWYWRPISHPSTNSTTITIMYQTSFC